MFLPVESMAPVTIPDKHGRVVRVVQASKFRRAATTRTVRTAGWCQWARAAVRPGTGLLLRRLASRVLAKTVERTPCPARGPWRARYRPPVAGKVWPVM